MRSSRRRRRRRPRPPSATRGTSTSSRPASTRTASSRGRSVTSSQCSSRPTAGPLTRAALRALDELDGWELVGLAHEAALVQARRPGSSARPGIACARAGAKTCAPACWPKPSIFVPAPGGHTRLRLEAAASGCAIADPPGAERQPELVTAAVARLGEDASSPRARGRPGERAGRDAELRAPRGPSSRASTCAWRTSGARRSRDDAIRSRTATGSSSTCTCTRAGRTTARSSPRT